VFFSHFIRQFSRINGHKITNLY